MDWINKLRKIFVHWNNIQHKDDHSYLALIMCVPCLLLTTLSLSVAGVSSYLIAFINIVLSLLAVFVVVISRQRSEQQIRTLSNILEAMIDGDYSLRGRLQHNQAFQELLGSVNSLAETLSQHKIEAKESRLLLEKIMQQMDAMVLAVDDQGFIVMSKQCLSKNLQKIQLVELELGEVISQANSGIIEFNHATLSGEHFMFKETFLSNGKQHQLYLITSAERLLIEKERKAWQSLFRVLSHEINNSLTPIAGISQAIKQKLKDENKALNRTSLCEGIDIINERAVALSAFIASYSQLSHLSLPNKTEFNLNLLVIKLGKLYADCQLRFLDHSVTADQMIISADKSQLEQVLINIFKNAHEAMVEPIKIIDINYQLDEKHLHLIISDQGVGIANPDNLFVPFYSTKPKGSGIGLSLCRQIMFNHGGIINVRNKVNAQGAEAHISLPLRLQKF
jgi:two-component system nitrogen regulation sensor histidine kinase NtrY